MVIAALLTFGILLVTWIAAPSDEARTIRVARAEAAERISLEATPRAA